MFYEDEDIFYYITLMNENYEMPILPIGATEGICRGIYRLSQRDLGPKQPRVRLLGSGAILREVLRAQDILDAQFGVSSRSTASPATRRSIRTPASANAGTACTRGKRRGGPTCSRRWTATAGRPWRPWTTSPPWAFPSPRGLGPDYTVLGTDGFGRSEARKELRRFFEVDAENIVLAALEQLVHKGQFSKTSLAQAIALLGLDPEKPNPATV